MDFLGLNCFSALESSFVFGLGLFAIAEEISGEFIGEDFGLAFGGTEGFFFLGLGESGAGIEAKLHG